MKGLITTVVAALVCTSAATGSELDVAYDWRPSLTVEADFDRDGQMDSAQLGVAAGGVGLRATLNAHPLPIIDIPIDGSKQFGICPGGEPSIRLAAQSEAPLNALGETPRGYEICEECVEIVVGGGECDALHFYWDTTTRQLAWWRA